MNIIVSKMLLPHIAPRTFKQFSENNASLLIGLELYISSKVKFTCKLFTLEQKKYFKNTIERKSYMVGNDLVVDPYTYEKFKKLGKELFGE